MEKYTCPFCKKEQTCIIQWQTCSIPYVYDLVSRDFEQKGEWVSGDIEGYQCQNCKEDLPTSLGSGLISG